MADTPPSERHRPAGGNGTQKELAARIYPLLWSDNGIEDRLEEGLELLELEYGDHVYTELLYQLSDLRLPPAEAREHWNGVVAHRRGMQKCMTSGVDLRVALINYFMSVTRLLHQPKIVEMREFEKARAGDYRDVLTGVRNSRFVFDFLPQEVARSTQYNDPLSLVMLDVDDLGLYNDQRGRDSGDEALRMVAGLLQGDTRRVDLLARRAGGEFVLILPSTPKDAAGHVAERLRVEVASQAFGGEEHDHLSRLTISLGVATFPADAGDADQLIRRAESALETAKSAGKNRVEYYGNSQRSYRRVQAKLPGTFSAELPMDHPMTTVNLSTGGMLIRTEHRPDENAVIQTRLEVPGTAKPLPATGRVVYAGLSNQGFIEVGIRTVEMSATDRWRLSEYLRGVDAQGGVN
jgi:diguanylate cyclase (GGDEF)-like protein